MKNGWKEGMRDSFFRALLNEARKNNQVMLLTADIGAICHDEFKTKLSRQYINAGIAEQNMIGVAAGLAQMNKIVYVYSIVPFITLRCLEQIRVDLCCMNLPVTIVSIGAGVDYSTLGATHHGTEDIGIMRSLPNMTIYNPSDSTMAELLAQVDSRQSGPKYIRLDRTGYPLIYQTASEINLEKGFSVIKKGSDLTIIATGRMVSNALEISEYMAKKSIRIGVIDLFRIKPVNSTALWNELKKTNHILSLEEHNIIGGIGSVVSEILAGHRQIPAFKPIGISDKFCLHYGERIYLQSVFKIDTKSVIKNIEKWIKKHP